jgi:hypothetical protein
MLWHHNTGAILTLHHTINASRGEQYLGHDEVVDVEQLA